MTWCIRYATPNKVSPSNLDLRVLNITPQLRTPPITRHTQQMIRGDIMDG
jgi:hypothetical protein